MADNLEIKVSSSKGTPIIIQEAGPLEVNVQSSPKEDMKMSKEEMKLQILSSVAGAKGDSMYDIAVKHGYTGTEEEFIETYMRSPETFLVDENGFHIVDENLNVGMKYDENGFDAAKVPSHFIDVLKTAGVGVDDVMTSYAAEVDEDGFFIADESLNIGVKVDNDGIHSKNILEYEIIEN